MEFFVKHGQFLLPMIDLIEQSSMAIDEMIDVIGRGAVIASSIVNREAVRMT